MYYTPSSYREALWRSPGRSSGCWCYNSSHSRHVTVSWGFDAIRLKRAISFPELSMQGSCHLRWWQSCRQLLLNNPSKNEDRAAVPASSFSAATWSSGTLVFRALLCWLLFLAFRDDWWVSSHCRGCRSGFISLLLLPSPWRGGPTGQLLQTRALFRARPNPPEMSWSTMSCKISLVLTY